MEGVRDRRHAELVLPMLAIEALKRIMERYIERVCGGSVDIVLADKRLALIASRCRCLRLKIWDTEYLFVHLCLSLGVPTNALCVKPLTPRICLNAELFP